MTLGERIKELRQAKKWSQVELAKHSELNRNSIYSYENNLAMPRMPQLTRLAGALGVTVEELQTGNIPARGLKKPKDWDEMSAAWDKIRALGFAIDIDPDEPYAILTDDETNNEYRLTMEQFTTLQKNVASYTRFQIQELLKGDEDAKT